MLWDKPGASIRSFMVNIISLVINFGIAVSKWRLYFTEEDNCCSLNHWHRSCQLTLWSAKIIIVPHGIIWSWYTGRWWVGCYIWKIQRGWDWAGPKPTHASLHCTKCNSPPINGQCTNHRICLFDVKLYKNFKDFSSSLLHTLCSNMHSFKNFIIRSMNYVHLYQYTCVGYSAVLITGGFCHIWYYYYIIYIFLCYFLYFVLRCIIPAFTFLHVMA